MILELLVGSVLAKEDPFALVSEAECKPREVLECVYSISNAIARMDGGAHYGVAQTVIATGGTKLTVKADEIQDDDVNIAVTYTKKGEPRYTVVREFGEVTVSDEQNTQNDVILGYQMSRERTERDGRISEAEYVGTVVYAFTANILDTNIACVPYHNQSVNELVEEKAFYPEGGDIIGNGCKPMIDHYRLVDIGKAYFNSLDINKDGYLDTADAASLKNPNRDDAWRQNMISREDKE